MTPAQIKIKMDGNQLILIIRHIVCITPFNSFFIVFFHGVSYRERLSLRRAYLDLTTQIFKPRHRDLTKEETRYNRALAKVRIAIEHVNRRCKIFRIVKETYRGKHKHDHKTWTVVAALVNLRYA